MSHSFSTYVFHRDDLAIAMDEADRVIRVRTASGETLPNGVSICLITEDPTGAVAQSPRAWDGKVNDRITRLADAWKRESEIARWTRAAWEVPFAALDIESDGARIWEVALLASSGAPPYLKSCGPIPLDTLQSNLNRILPGRILAGHNIRNWDFAILKRLGMTFPLEMELWDTLEIERELCADHDRPSYALQTMHTAERDARLTLDLARNQWLRKHGAGPASEEAWAASRRFFIVPEPAWLQCSKIDPATLAWDGLEDVFNNLQTPAITSAMAEIEWLVAAPSRAQNALAPFNPASPKRVEYWYRLLPLLDAARRSSGAAALFVRHEHEIPTLLSVMPGSFTGDTRRCARVLARQGGLLILHDSTWNRTLAEGLPDDTTVILEHMPESDANADLELDSGNLAIPDPHGDVEAAQAWEDSPFDSLPLPATRKALPVPHLQAMGRMALWRHARRRMRFVCLDSRFWTRRSEAPFQWKPLPGDGAAVVSREQLAAAGFRQTTGVFHLSDTWERDISEWFLKEGQSLLEFQRSNLAEILPRTGLSHKYVERATGGGKSLIFQAAALYRGAETGRLTVVISPLRALIHDQVSKLHARGFALDVEALSGEMLRDDVDDTYRRIAGGETKLVYTAPERFRSSRFLQALETRLCLDAGGEPEYWVFDEAHCISLWGLEFRPDYRKAAVYIRKRRADAGADAAPILLVSATLTNLAKSDIEAVLGLAT